MKASSVANNNWRPYFASVLATLGVFCLPNTSKGDFLLIVDRVGGIEREQNSVVHFDIGLRATVGTSVQLEGFSLFFDIVSPAGKGLPSGIGQIRVANYFSGFGSSAEDPNAVDTKLANDYTSTNFDFSVNAENTSLISVPTDTLTTAATPLPLFRLSIDTGTLDGGTYTLAFRDDPIGDGDSIRSLFPPLSGSGDFGSLDPSSTSSSSFSITAVPEPSSMVLFAMASGGALTAWRRRRVASKNV
jgi:hypothetical protein